MHTSDLPNKLRDLRDVLTTGLIERETPLRLALLAALTGEHLLLIGPPGTAKSELARRLHHAFHDATYFERLLTRFSTPEELFGPLSIKALEQDRYERKTEHYLPEAAIAFLDEIFKANSAILNALLTLLNEREFDNGTERKKTPLICVVAASNELPDGDELNALYDRFLLRYQVGPVSDAGYNLLLDLRGAGGFQAPGTALKLRREDVEQISREAEKVKLPDEVKALLMEFRKFLAEQKISLSDRRSRKIVKLLQTSALTNGRQDISIWDCWLLQYCVWETPEQHPAARDWFEKRLGTNNIAAPAQLVRLVGVQEKLLSNETQTTTQLKDKKGNSLYWELDCTVAKKVGNRQKVNEKGQPLFQKPNANRRYDNETCTKSELEGLFHRQSEAEKYAKDIANFVLEVGELLPVMEQSKYSTHHVDGRKREVKKILKDIEAQIASLDHHIASLTSTVDGHLWIQPGFSAVAKRSLEESRVESEILRSRLQTVFDGISKLPVLDEEKDE